MFQEIMNTPEKGIPEDLLNKAHCIVIVPGVKKLALGIGGKYGRGFTLCRGKIMSAGALRRLCVWKVEASAGKSAGQRATLCCWS